MTTYQFYMEEKEICLQLSEVYAQKQDGCMQTFYANAAKGFETKARNLSIEEACK